MKPIALMAALCAAPAAAQNAPCFGYADLMAALASGYGEVSVGYGLISPSNAVMQLFVSESGTWTLVIVRPDGMACGVAAGDNWTFDEQPWPKAGELN
jgi:hypothetical protein